ncbi:MAG: DNA modification methylase [Deltaproteobacteria bacterium]|nr:DNA modification methylase [Deltaproteobacteria bacterium]
MLKVQYLKTENLRPWPENPRKNDHAVEVVAKSIKAFGFNVPIVCDHNFVIVAGHTRWKAAKSLSLAEVPVVVVELSDPQRRAFSVADNKTAEIADWDFPGLRQILKGLESDEVSLDAIGFSNEELRRILDDDDAKENIPAIAEKTEIRFGDRFELGSHRLICGDSREPSSIHLGVDERPVDHIFGGPPYFNQREYAQWSSYDEYLTDMQKIIVNCFDNLKDGGVVTWNIANGVETDHNHVAHHASMFEDAGFRFLDTIVWVKPHANYSVPRNLHIQRNHLYYPALRWEALLVYQKPGPLTRMTDQSARYMADHHSDVWEVAPVTKQQESYGHPAVCPVELPYRSILAYAGPKSARILEPFGGSGTTLIAAEMAGRSAILVERKPEYCDVILRRWQKFTGMPTRRIETRT